MAAKKEPKMSAVAMMENWKAAVSKEVSVAAVFEENWGYLKARPDETKPRPYETRLVKYFNRGKATVKDKRIPLDVGNRGDTPETPENEKVVEDPAKIEKTISAARWRPTNFEYGSRGNLELFGISDHGIKATITKHAGF